MPPFETKIEIPAAAADTTETFLLELEAGSWSLLEDVIAKRAWLVGIHAAQAQAMADWAELEPRLRAEGVIPSGAPEWRALVDADWRDSYKAHFHAWQFGRLHWVPVWERSKFMLPEGDAVLWLDPGMAFGTGNHETTRLCVERLAVIAAAADVSRLSVIDAGCGSGILALSAARLGFRDIVGFDDDAEAVLVSEDNARLNGMAGRVRFFAGDLISGLAGRSADVVLANIQSDVLQRFTPELVAAVTPGGSLVLSGILASERDSVRATFAAACPGWSVESRVMGEWSDVMLSRPRLESRI